MIEPREIRPECEHRMTKMETIISNHVPHVNDRLKTIERMLWGLIISMLTVMVGAAIAIVGG